jgi:23S rRNA pseudouridine955/2504/2580 synthase
MAEARTVAVAPTDAGMRLDRWLRQRFPGLAQGRVEKLLRTGQVRLDGRRAKANERLAPGQTVRLPPFIAETAAAPAPPAPAEPPASERETAELARRVLYRDEHVIALDKPVGMAVQGGPRTGRHLDALLDALRFGAPDRPRLVHRLDRDTSGVLLLARHAAAARALAAAFRGKAAAKLYWAIVVGVPKPHQGKIDLPLAKKPGPGGAEKMAAADRREAGDDRQRAVTLFRVIEPAGKRAAWVLLQPLTGRTHQLRAHCAAIGTPILGDGKYGGKAAFLPGAEAAGQVHLHARRLILPHPAEPRRAIDVSADPPPHLAASMAYFGFAPGERPEADEPLLAPCD